MNHYGINKNSYIASFLSRYTYFLLRPIMILTLSGVILGQSPESMGKEDKVNSGNHFSNSINMCPLSVIFGLYSVNFEKYLGGNSGIVGRFDYESISDKYFDNPIEVNGYGFILNYRYHLSGEMESYFIGSYFRYRIYSGEGTTSGNSFNFKINEATAGLNAGKRWVWSSGFNITFALGYGVSDITRTKSTKEKVVSSTLSAFENEYAFIGPFLGEFSIGYAF